MADITLNVKATELNDVVNKASKSLNNITNEAKKEITSYFFPDYSNYISISFTQNMSYTAPANGFIRLVKSPGTSGAWQSFNVSSAYRNAAGTDQVAIVMSSSTRTNGYALMTPIQKGEVIRIYGSMTGETIVCEFIYARGEI